MKTSRLLKFAIVITTLFAFSACEDENIIVKNTDGDSQVENGDAE
ncbi:MAG: hypothetical protein OEW67_09405 [Cyclobacteriaceae bacterium]|nr:hypothetical protein [Cyclobacteriaceae bacterium]